jgi:hypothetical protein
MSQEVMKLLRKEHRTELQALFSCGKTFKTLQNSNQANFMMNNCKAPIPDSLLRFIIQARCGTLITPALQYKFHWIEKAQSICSCWGRDEQCNLFHIAGACKKRMYDYTTRHNNVLEKVKDLIDLTIKPEKIHMNKCIKLKETERRSEIQPINNIHPDMWYWHETDKVITLEIIEMKVPWGTVGQDEAGEDITSMEKVERKAIKKYDELIKGNIEKGNLALKDIIRKEINGKKVKIQLTVLIISSLGAIGPKMFGKIRRLAGGTNKQKVSLTLKRMVMAALKGTRMCWLKQNNWYTEPKDNHDQFLEKQLFDLSLNYEADGIVYEDEERRVADITHEALLDEISGDEVADMEECEMNSKAEEEIDLETIFPIETPFRNWTEFTNLDRMEGYQEYTTTKEQMGIYNLGFGKDDAEDEYERMTSSDEDFPKRSWSDGVWIVTPSDSSNEQFLPHSE